MFATALTVCLFVAVQDKPSKITPENIEVGKTGTIDRLTVEKAFPDNDRIIAAFGSVRVLVVGFPAKGIGKGRVLPKDQVWSVDSVIDRDGSGNDLSGCYLIKPVKKK